MKSIAPILVTLFLLVVPASAQHKRAQLDTLRAEGYEALYNLDYEGARSRFQKMIDLAPDHPAGAQCYASSLWLQQLNQAWELKATLYSTNATLKENRKQIANKPRSFANGHVAQNSFRKRGCGRIRATWKRSIFSVRRKGSRPHSRAQSNGNSRQHCVQAQIPWTIIVKCSNSPQNFAMRN